MSERRSNDLSAKARLFWTTSRTNICKQPWFRLTGYSKNWGYKRVIELLTSQKRCLFFHCQYELCLTKFSDSDCSVWFSDTELTITQPLELEPKGEDKSCYTLALYGNSLTALYFSRWGQPTWYDSMTSQWPRHWQMEETRFQYPCEY